jgi:YesN/AraC family two-component response regulator
MSLRRCVQGGDCAGLRWCRRRRPGRVLTAESGPHGLRLLQEQEVDLPLVDIFMPSMDGLEVIPLLHKTRPACKIIAMSGGAWEWDYLDTAKQLGANDMLKKPFSLQELLDAVSAQLK